MRLSYSMSIRLSMGIPTIRPKLTSEWCAQTVRIAWGVTLVPIRTNYNWGKVESLFIISEGGCSILGASNISQEFPRLRQSSSQNTHSYTAESRLRGRTDTISNIISTAQVIIVVRIIPMKFLASGCIQYIPRIPTPQYKLICLAERFAVRHDKSRWSSIFTLIHVPDVRE
jgi:hypothetical protein